MKFYSKALAIAYLISVVGLLLLELNQFPEGGPAAWTDLAELRVDLRTR